MTQEEKQAVIAKERKFDGRETLNLFKTEMEELFTLTQGNFESIEYTIQEIVIITWKDSQDKPVCGATLTKSSDTLECQIFHGRTVVDSHQVTIPKLAQEVSDIIGAALL